MSVESSFFKDRPANEDELNTLPDDTPEVTGASQYEDLYKVSAEESYFSERKFVPRKGKSSGIKRNRENWFFRVN